MTQRIRRRAGHADQPRDHGRTSRRWPSVSVKTVSRVVNDEPGVSPEVRRRVLEAAERLGYRHNLTASNLRRGQRTASIGVLVQDLSNDFCGELLRAVEARARERGVVVMSASPGRRAGA